MEPEEISEGGHPIYRYGERSKPFEHVHGDAKFVELVTKHIDKHLGNRGMVFHEIISDLVHIDVHMIPPSPERNYNILITSGMSERAMKAPEGCEEFSYTELMICLPPDWPLQQKDFDDERNYWPIRLLKTLARFPHEYDTWLFEAHTVPHGDPPEPFCDNVEFTGALLAFPTMFPEEFWQFKVTPEITIHFLVVIPVYTEEMDLKLKKDAEALFDKFDKHGVSELVDLTRPNVAKSRWKLW